MLSFLLLVPLLITFASYAFCNICIDSFAGGHLFFFCAKGNFNMMENCWPMPYGLLDVSCNKFPISCRISHLGSMDLSTPLASGASLLLSQHSSITESQLWCSSVATFYAGRAFINWTNTEMAFIGFENNLLMEENVPSSHMHNIVKPSLRTQQLVSDVSINSVGDMMNPGTW